MKNQVNKIIIILNQQNTIRQQNDIDKTAYHMW
jgi:hypothetical protein